MYQFLKITSSKCDPWLFLHSWTGNFQRSTSIWWNVLHFLAYVFFQYFNRQGVAVENLFFRYSQRKKSIGDKSGRRGGQLIWPHGAPSWWNHNRCLKLKKSCKCQISHQKFDFREKNSHKVWARIGQQKILCLEHGMRKCNIVVKDNLISRSTLANYF